MVKTDSADSTESEEVDGHSWRPIIAILALVVLVPLASATELGVNYYHESLWTPEWQQPHIPVSEAQARDDFREIKKISNEVKFYLTPFAEGNLYWIETLSRIAREEGLGVAVNIMVDDRQLGDHNWAEYRYGVLRACEQLNGKADVMLVGNEITLHSSWSAWDVRHRIEPLINECDARFSGETSYEAFWYEKDAFTSYDGPIYFMHYESLDRFENNVREMDSLFGSDARVGEWGEDLNDEGTKRDDWWQKDQIEKRWEIIQRTNTPVAYLFAYREPSWDSFGMVRPDGVKRPLWEVFGHTQDDSDPIADPVVEPSAPVDQPGDATSSDLSGLSVRVSPSGSTSSDVVSGVCRTVSFDTSSGRAQVLICDKGSSYESYWQSGPSDVSICVEGSCVRDSAGFARIAKSGSSDSEKVSGSSDVSSLTISSLSVSSSPGGSKNKDVVSGVCRTVAFDTSAGYAEAQICDKGSHFEAYWKGGSNQASICFESSCVRETAGFARIEK